MAETGAEKGGGKGGGKVAEKGVEKVMAAPIVFFDIAGENDADLGQFYNTCFGWNVSSEGTIDVEVTAQFGGAIRRDPAEKRLYIGVESIAATQALIIKNGGEIEQERFEVPGTAVLCLFKDPAGNPMGLIELTDGKITVP
ncbi:MAG: hypothetical protein AAF991_10635 [Pseudomonadota bacterium]